MGNLLTANEFAVSSCVNPRLKSGVNDEKKWNLFHVDAIGKLLDIHEELVEKEIPQHGNEPARKLRRSLIQVQILDKSIEQHRLCNDVCDSEDAVAHEVIENGIFLPEGDVFMENKRRKEPQNIAHDVCGDVPHIQLEHQKIAAKIDQECKASAHQVQSELSE